ncbi:cytochrome P450 [Schizopora paradoxa]|uniref:Cytochrome P450 n=1 Tax=Schizopora paradoxa TaxID=27342 RepID=A0A0H2SSP1_9AGAM|nr:cytochrome P450 [Schizopora paradoxa]
MALPPGISYLLANGHKWFGPTIVLVILRSLSQKYLDAQIPLPNWLQNVLLLATLPGFFVVRVYWHWFKTLREARKAGAVLPPTIVTKWPGALDVLLRGNAEDQKRYIGDNIAQFNGTYGYTFNFRMLFENRIMTSEPEHIKQILATEFNNFEKGPITKTVMQPLLGDGVFNSDGEMWKFHRSMTRPFFSRDRISHFELFGRHADAAIALMKDRLATGHSVDFQDVIGRFTLDSATEFLFGKCVHSLSAGLPYSPVVTSSFDSPSSKDFSTQFVEAFSLAQTKTAKRSRFGTAWPLFHFWSTGSKDSMDTIYSFIEPIMHEVIAKRKEKIAAGIDSEKRTDAIDESESFLDNLIKYTDDPIILRDEILNIMIAGRDTTAATLTYVMYCLSMHPEVLAKLRQEILNSVGSERYPTYEDLREMKYLRAVINETLRLYPPVPMNSRTSIKPTTFPNNKPGAKPWYVPARTRCAYSVFIMHRRKDLWGPDADLFDPDRFLDERLQKYLTPNPFIFLPFNAGPRICLGQQFAYNETSFMLIRLLQSFDGVNLAVDEQPPASRAPVEWSKAVGERKRLEKIKPKNHLTLYAEGGLWVRMKQASSSEAA